MTTTATKVGMGGDMSIWRVDVYMACVSPTDQKALHLIGSVEVLAKTDEEAVAQVTENLAVEATPL